MIFGTLNWREASEMKGPQSTGIRKQSFAAEISGAIAIDERREENLLIRLLLVRMKCDESHDQGKSNR